MDIVGTCLGFNVSHIHECQMMQADRTEPRQGLNMSSFMSVFHQGRTICPVMAQITRAYTPEG